MIDYSSNPFGLSMAYVFGREVMYFTDETEDLRDKIINTAKTESQECTDFVEYLLDSFGNEYFVRCMFSATVFNKVVHTCNTEGEDKLLAFYLRVYRMVIPTMQEQYLFDSTCSRVIDTCFRLHMNAEDVGEIGSLMLSLQRIPVAFIVDKYLKSRPKTILEYVNQSTFIYDINSSAVDTDAILTDSETHEKLIRSLYRICNQLRRIVNHRNQRSFMDLTWEAVNAQEGTSFSESFINWLKWAAARAKYIGTRERNDGNPSWCFAPFSMDVCIDDEFFSGLGELYDLVCDVLGMDRENDVTIRLEPYFKGDVLPDDVVYPPLFTNDPRYDPDKDKEPLKFSGHVISKSVFLQVCQRLLFAANAGAYINEDGDAIIVPAGKAIEKYELLRKI